MRFTPVSLFSKTVDRLVTGWFLTTVFVVPSIRITISSIDSVMATTLNFAELHNVPIINKGLKKINKVLLFVEDADTKFSQQIDLEKWLKNPINIEKILGYLIFLALIWESPRIFYFLVINHTHKLFIKNSSKKLSSTLETTKIKKLVTSDSVVWKQNPYSKKAIYSHLAFSSTDEKEINEKLK